MARGSLLGEMGGEFGGSTPADPGRGQSRMPRTAFLRCRAPGAEQEQKIRLGSCWGQVDGRRGERRGQESTEKWECSG